MSNMTDYFFIGLILMLPVAGILFGVVWNLFKFLVRVFRNCCYWWHYRRYRINKRQKIEPLL